MTELTIPRYAPIWRTILQFNTSLSLSSGELRQYVEIPNKDDINFSTKEDFTVAFWVFAAKKQLDLGNSDNSIVEKWSSEGGYPYVIRFLNEDSGEEDAGKIVAARYDGTQNPTVMSTKKIDDDQYHHIAFVRKTEGNSAKLHLYVDGMEVANSNDNTTGETKNDSPLYLGRRGNGINYFTGSIGRLLIFKRGLDEEEIWYWMRQNNPILPQDNREWLKEKICLVGDWRCNEGYGAIAFDYAKSNNGKLGGSDGLTARPEWVVSTIPTFVEFIKDDQLVGTKSSPPAETQSSPPGGSETSVLLKERQKLPRSIARFL